MTSYGNLKIRNKLIIGFATVVCMALAIGIFGYFQIHTLERADHVLFNKGVKPVEHIGDIAADFQRLRVNIREYILASDKKIHDHYRVRVIKFREEIDASVVKLEEKLPDAESKKLYARLIQTRSNYTPHVNRILELAKPNRFEEAVKYMRSDAVYLAEHDEIEAIENLQSYLVSNAEIISEKNIETAMNSSVVMLCLAFGASLLATIMTILITRSIANPLRTVLGAIRSQQEGSREKALIVEAIAGGNLNQEVMVTEPLQMDMDEVNNDEAGMLLKAIVEMSEVQNAFDLTFAKMSFSLRRNRDQESQRTWFRFGQNELNFILRGDKSTAEMTHQVLTFLTEYLGAGVGVFYVFDEKESMLEIAASYALSQEKRLNNRLALGEGLAGQAALEKKIITMNDAPANYLQINSGLGESEPSHIVAIPLLHNNTLIGLIELGSFSEFGEDHLEFLKQIMEALAIGLSVNKSRQQVNELLEQTQSQTEELRVQQEELQQTNEELEERAQMLEQQREQIRAKNREVEEASRELQRKADELERVSAYKSEFLANMSHELRTPLNSLMILSSLLRDNRDGNLSEKQVEFAATINGAGRDLLHLINDILDLSKIESGHLEFHYEDLALSELHDQMESVFQPIAQDKDIRFTIQLDQATPAVMTTDRQRTQQILKNLLSNACKFTHSGTVSLHIYSPVSSENPLGTSSVAFAVTDTGIGIAEDKQSLIFNAFQQADGSTSRTYGGTGLGLSISRQLARSMGGEITLRSETGSGSTFTLYLPVHGDCSLSSHVERPALPAIAAPNASMQRLAEPAPVSFKSPDPLPAPIPDDRELLQSGDKCILVIEDDLTFAGILSDMVRGRAFSVLVAADGESGIALAERYQPSAIILDVMLPHIDGWGVMRSLKDNSHTRHIPVHFITCLEERQKAMSMGAIGFVTKPVSSEQLDAVFGTLESAIEKTMKMLLIVEDDQKQAAAMVALLEERNVTIKVAESGDKAIELLSTEHFDCIVLDLGLADMGAFELLEELKKLDPERRIPVIIHTGRELTHEDERKLHHYAESIIIKGAKSPERLLNEVTLFLHLIETSLDPGKQRMIRSALDKEAMLDGKKVLIVDDDMRNIFSLSSALSEKNITIYEAENGREALKQLDNFPDIDLVLMDIMMPEMDGYEAMRCIRKDLRFETLPIIALTAKAMKGDREECLKAGASDYIPKPVDMDKLFSLLRVWLYSTTADRAEIG
ncbi:MAG: regulator [Geobacteraceae bacterium GWC2_53_11]|nr:MAG: regulator [Geobacteraceae bacterium GWC2_53_11]